MEAYNTWLRKRNKNYSYTSPIWVYSSEMKQPQARTWRNIPILRVRDLLRFCWYFPDTKDVVNKKMP